MLRLQCGHQHKCKPSRVKKVSNHNLRNMLMVRGMDRWNMALCRDGRRSLLDVFLMPETARSALRQVTLDSNCSH